MIARKTRFVSGPEGVAAGHGFGRTLLHAHKRVPREELFDLTAQIRRAASSIAANIAEGYGRKQTKTYVQFLRIAQGSLKELETHLLLAQRARLSPGKSPEEILLQCEELGKMLRALIRRLQPRDA